MPLSVPTPLSDISAAVWAYAARRLTNLDDARAARIDNLDVLLSSRLSKSDFDIKLPDARAARIDNLDATISSREAEADALARYTNLLAGIGAIPTTPELEADALARYTALAASMALLVATSHFDASEFEAEWQTDPVVQNVASAIETALTAGSITPTYPTGAVERRVILLPIIKAASMAGNTHHIGLKVQYRLGGAGGYSDLKDFTANPPLTLAVVDGSTDSWAQPIDVTAIVSSGVQVEFRFAVDSDNAGSVNYTTSFLLALVYRMG